MHGPKYRSHVLLIVGMIVSAAILLLPMLAWVTFPQPWDFVLFGSLNSKLKINIVGDIRCARNISGSAALAQNVSIFLLSSQLANLFADLRFAQSNKWPHYVSDARESEIFNGSGS